MQLLAEGIGSGGGISAVLSGVHLFIQEKNPCASALEGTCSLAERDKGEKSDPGPDLQHRCHQKAEH